MAGIIGSNVSFSIFEADGSAFSAEKLRQHAFVPDIETDVVRMGWVGLGELLDYTSFELAVPDGGFVGFSYRLDVRKPASALLKLKLAEAILAEEEKKGGHLSKARRKELREEITDSLTKKADFVPALIDCVWDLSNNQLFITSVSQKILDSVLKFFQKTFDVEPISIAPEVDMPVVLMKIHQSEDLHLAGYALEAMGSANLVNTESEEKSQVTVQNDTKAVAQAIQDGLLPSKLHLKATADEDENIQLDFVLASDLTVNKLKLPKPEKGASKDAVFLVNADLCAKVSKLINTLGSWQD